MFLFSFNNFKSFLLLDMCIGRWFLYFVDSTRICTCITPYDAQMKPKLSNLKVVLNLSKWNKIAVPLKLDS